MIFFNNKYTHIRYTHLVPFYNDGKWSEYPLSSVWTQFLNDRDEFQIETKCI